VEAVDEEGSQKGPSPMASEIHALPSMEVLMGVLEFLFMPHIFLLEN